MNHDLGRIRSRRDTRVSILTYIRDHVSLEHEISNLVSGEATDVQVEKYFQNSPDYQKLVSRLEAQRAKIGALNPAEVNRCRFETEKMAALERYELEFKTSALRLASTFLKIGHRTQRLKRARACFERGLIAEADQALVEIDLIGDQAALLVQMDYLRQRSVHLLRTLVEITSSVTDG